MKIIILEHQENDKTISHLKDQLTLVTSADLIDAIAEVETRIANNKEYISFWTDLSERCPEKDKQYERLINEAKSQNKTFEVCLGILNDKLSAIVSY